MLLPVSFLLLAIAGLVTLVMALTVVKRTSEATIRYVNRPEPTKPKWDVDVEVVLVPPSGDWETAIQKQLDAIENRSPDNELVAATSVNGKIILFYKRRIG